MKSFSRLVASWYEAFIRLFTINFSLLILSRILEFTVVSSRHHLPNVFDLLPGALYYDFIVALFLSLIFSVLLRLVSLKSLRIALITIPLILIHCINLLLILYFVAILEPLDRVIFTHSFEDMLYVIQEFGEFDPLYLLLLLVPVLYLWISRLTRAAVSSKWFRIVCGLGVGLAVVLSLVFASGLTPQRKQHQSFKDYYVIANKTAYFTTSLLQDEEDESMMNLSRAISTFQGSSEKDLISTDYPYIYRGENEKSVLAPYFKKGNDTLPNLVFLVVESLSTAFSGSNARDMSFTPFLDTLSQQGLYFPNVVSVGERTFSVIPSGLASLPHGRQGFTKREYKMPNHHSIPQILIDNGYDGAFFYGGDPHYSFYDTFMETQGVEHIYGRKSAVNEAGKEEGGADERFGEDDGVMLQSALDALDSIADDQPYVHTYLTLTTHYPFSFEGSENYVEQVHHIVNNAELSDDTREAFLKYDYVLASILYSDRELGQFFEEYRKRSDFENTIFFIFGDHRIAGLPYPDDLDVYHVPLTIYSPLLEETGEFPALNSHLDIAPSVISLMREKYDLPTPDTLHWLGSQFNKDSTFSSNRKFSMMLNNRDVEQFVYNNFFYSFGDLYRIRPDLSLEETQNDILKERIKELMEAEKTVSRYAVDNNRILPESSGIMGRSETLVQKSDTTWKSIGPSVEFDNLMTAELTKNYQSIELTINLELASEREFFELDNLARLVVVVNGESESPLWTSYNLKNVALKGAEKNHLSVNLTEVIRSNKDVSLSAGSVVTVYFWNEQKTQQEFRYKVSGLSLKGKAEQ